MGIERGTDFISKSTKNNVKFSFHNNCYKFTPSSQVYLKYLILTKTSQRPYKMVAQYFDTNLLLLYHLNFRAKMSADFKTKNQKKTRWLREKFWKKKNLKKYCVLYQNLLTTMLVDHSLYFDLLNVSYFVIVWAVWTKRFCQNFGPHFYTVSLFSVWLDFRAFNLNSYM